MHHVYLKQYLCRVVAQLLCSFCQLQLGNGV